jgi:PBP1b-binding outer membrane lipoprotein LpoB
MAAGSIAGRAVRFSGKFDYMKQSFALVALCVAIVLSGCASFSDDYEYQDIDVLIEEAAWETVSVLWDSYDDLDTAPSRNMAVYYFLEGGAISPLSDTLIEGLTTEIANAINYEGIQVRIVSRTNLDQILQELAFQSSDLVDAETQISVGKQLGAKIVVTGTISPVDRGKKFNIQLIEVETGVVLGGYIMYLIQE